MAGAPDGLRQPERVQPDAAAHIEAAGTLGQAELGDDPSGLGCLKAVHALERLLRSFAFFTMGVTHSSTSPSRSLSAMVLARATRVHVRPRAVMPSALERQQAEHRHWSR